MPWVSQSTPKNKVDGPLGSTILAGLRLLFGPPVRIARIGPGKVVAVRLQPRLASFGPLQPVRHGSLGGAGVSDLGASWQKPGCLCPPQQRDQQDQPSHQNDR